MSVSNTRQTNNTLVKQDVLLYADEETPEQHERDEKWRHDFQGHWEIARGT